MSIQSFNTQEFIDTQKFLANLSEKPKYPIYTPIGMPLLISLSSLLTNFDMYLVRIVIPVSVFFLYLLQFLKKIKDTLFIFFNFYIAPNNYCTV